MGYGNFFPVFFRFVCIPRKFPDIVYIRSMKLHLINEEKEKFKKALLNDSAIPDSLMRLCILDWQKHFDIEEWRLGPIIEKALKNKVSGRYWGGEKDSIKSGLILLSNHNPDLFWEGIKDLLNEDRMIIMRVSRFVHHCDAILKDLKGIDLKINTHHQDYYSASLLLSLHHPANYCLFNFNLFEKFCKRIGVNDLPVDTDIERYYKILRAVYKIISKDDAFMNAYYSKLDANVYFGPSLSIVYDFMKFGE